MRKVAWLAAVPLLIANQFTAREFEVAAHFMALVQQHQLVAAKRMLAPNAVIHSWQREGQQSFETFATYVTACPIHDFEGNDNKASHNINVKLDCPGENGASLTFTNGKISEIDFGPPPVIHIYAPRPKGQ